MDLDTYISAHSDAEPPYLAAIARRTHLRLLNPRMIAGHMQGRLLKMFCEMIRPHNILELGAFVGYSALCMAEGTDENAVIHTIECDDELEDMIRENLACAPFRKKIILHIGNALEVIKTLENISFDLVFIDADKKEYIAYYQAVMPLVRKGGFILADNTLWNGKIVGQPSGNDRRTIEIQEFNDLIAQDRRIEKIILPLRDGLTIMKKL